MYATLSYTETHSLTHTHTHTRAHTHTLTPHSHTVNAFNADRKRMSILVKDIATSQYYVMCKGADCVMLSPELCPMSQSTLHTVNQTLLGQANLGLRTLCIG